MGFVFPEREAAGWPEIQEAPEVLAWARTTPAAAGMDLPHETLATLLARAPRTPFEAVRHGRQPVVMLDASAVDVLGITAEQAAGPSLWLAAGAGRRAGGPAHLALPLTLVRDPGTVLFAHAAGDDTNPLRVLDTRVTDLPADAG